MIDNELRNVTQSQTSNQFSQATGEVDAVTMHLLHMGSDHKSRWNSQDMKDLFLNRTISDYSGK